MSQYGRVDEPKSEKFSVCNFDFYRIKKTTISTGIKTLMRNKFKDSSKTEKRYFQIEI